MRGFLFKIQTVYAEFYYIYRQLCSMQKYYFAVFAFFLSLANGQTITFNDVNFKAKLLAASPSNQIAKNLAGIILKLMSIMMLKFKQLKLDWLVFYLFLIQIFMI